MEDDPRDTLKVMMWAGLAALLIGLVVLVLGWPGTETCRLGDDGCDEFGLKESGSAAAQLIGGVLAGAGQVLVFIAGVGQGVRLGTRAAERDRPSV